MNGAPRWDVLGTSPERWTKRYGVVGERVPHSVPESVEEPAVRPLAPLEGVLGRAGQEDTSRAGEEGSDTGERGQAHGGAPTGQRRDTVDGRGFAGGEPQPHEAQHAEHRQHHEAPLRLSHPVTMATIGGERHCTPDQRDRPSPIDANCGDCGDHVPTLIPTLKYRQFPCSSYLWGCGDILYVYV